MNKYSLDNFLIDVKNIHNDKYDYSKIVWKNKTTKIIIICKEHGEFKQTPSNHLLGKGCSYCSGVGRITKNIFLERIQLIHGDLYEYDIKDKDYIKNTEKIGINCKEHGKFYQTPKNHLKGQKCPKCSKFYKYNEMEFIEKCKKIHGEKYDYTDINYKAGDIKINIKCKLHGFFEQLPLNHLKGNGCYKCKNLCRTTQDFIEKATKIHNDTYDYSKVKYNTSREKVIIICKKHGDFLQSPNDHLNGCGCMKCNYYRHSKVSLIWLKQIETKLGYEIQHAGNIGEKEIKINNKIIKFDGYDNKTNTVFEFYGDFFHGNPKTYNKDDINPINKKKFGDLYKKTIDRENIIKNAGYNLITIWEKDFI